MVEPRLDTPTLMLVVPQVMKLIGAMFVIDVPELQFCESIDERKKNKKKGKLWELTLMVAARLIGSYNHLVRDLRERKVDVNNHPIVHMIRTACHKSQIHDSRVEVAGMHHWLAVLKSWSKTIQDDFEARNPPRASPTASIGQHLLCNGQQMDKVAASNNKLVEKVGEWERNAQSNAASSAEAITNLTKQVDVLTNEKERLVKENKKLARNNVILAMPYSSPAPATAASRPSYSSPPPPNKKQRSEEPPVDKPPPTSASSNVQPPAAAAAAATAATASFVQPPVATTAAAVAAALPPLPSSQPPTINPPKPGNALALLSGVLPTKPSIQGITVQVELERLYNSGIIKRKATGAVAAGGLKKTALFDDTLGFNSHFTLTSQGARYVKSMQMVAIAIEDKQWEVLCAGELEVGSESMRQLVADISKQTMSTLDVLEMQHGDREKASTRATPSLRAIADRFKKVWDTVKAAGNKSDVDMKVWFNEKLGISAGQQTMTSFMASNNTAPV